MAKLLVVGGRLESAPMSQEMDQFCRELGKQIIRCKHVLLTGCSNAFDRIVAEGAMAEIDSTPTLNRQSCICSWVLMGHSPSHRIGQLHNSKLRSWDIGERAFVLPEPIANADAVILVGGRRGTFRTANLARISGKPILPLTTFGGAAAMVFDHEVDTLVATGGNRAKRDELETLNAFAPADLGTYAKHIVSLAERMVSGTSVFVVMSFSKESEETCKVIDSVCGEYGFRANRTDKTNHVSRVFSKMHGLFTLTTFSCRRHAAYGPFRLFFFARIERAC